MGRPNVLASSRRRLRLPVTLSGRTRLANRTSSRTLIFSANLTVVALPRFFEANRKVSTLYPQSFTNRVR